MKFSASINKEIPMDIFLEPVLKERINQLFSNSDEKIKARITEILNFANLEPATQLSYENIVELFQAYFYKSILCDVIDMTFTKQGKYNVLDNILELLTDEKLSSAIIGKPMVDAFKKAISSIPVTDGLTAAIHGGKISLIEREFG